MCVAIVKPKGKDVSNKALELGFEANCDGAGFAYNYNGKLFVKKGYFNVENFIADIRETQMRYDNPAMIIHARLASHGVVNEANCHPFLVSDNLAVIHNGIIRGEYARLANSDPTHSDTYFFVEMCLKLTYKQDSRFYLDDVMKSAIESIVGGYNKLCFLDNEGNYSIINEDKGFWLNDVWYSNSSCQVAGFDANPALQSR